MALLTARSDRSRPLDWIQIGAVAGPTIELPSVALRSANFRLQGSGQGSVSPRAYLAELPSLVDEITAGTIAVRAERGPAGRRRGRLGKKRDPRRAHGPGAVACRSVDAVRGSGTRAGERDADEPAPCGRR